MVSVSEAKARLTELVRDSAKVDVWLTRHGRPVAVIVSAERYARLVAKAEK